MLSARIVQIPADPLRIARSLAGRPGLVLAWDARPKGTSWVACEPEAEVIGELDPEPELALTPHASELGAAPRWFGVLPFEACRSVERAGRPPAVDSRPAPHISSPHWLRYGAAIEVTPGRVRVIGHDPAQIRRLAAAIQKRAPATDASLALLEGLESEEIHEQRVRAALELIVRGELYQVNLARLFRLRAVGCPLEHLARQGSHTRAAYGFALSTSAFGVVSTSPELFLRTTPNGRILTSPIKGTRPRGNHADQDRALIAELEGDPKELAELTMIVDVERNDLGRLCRAGSVRLLGPYATTTLPTLHHRVAHVSGQLRPATTRTEVLEATLPSGSVTGAPKIRAMEVISHLESSRRGLYTGGFGLLRHDGGLELGMAIRTLSVVGGEGHYFAGGGIVADSDPTREVEETLWKARQIAAAAQNWPA